MSAVSPLLDFLLAAFFFLPSSFLITYSSVVVRADSSFSRRCGTPPLSALPSFLPRLMLRPPSWLRHLASFVLPSWRAHFPRLRFFFAEIFFLFIIIPFLAQFPLFRADPPLFSTFFGLGMSPCFFRHEFLVQTVSLSLVISISAFCPTLAFSSGSFPFLRGTPIRSQPHPAFFWSQLNYTHANSSF